MAGSGGAAALAENDKPNVLNPLSPGAILQRKLACTDCTPVSLPNVQMTDACPTASVVVEVADKVPVPLMIVQVTVSPTTGSPAAVTKETVSGIGRGCPAIAV
jgi:hypothetical protein